MAVNLSDKAMLVRLSISQWSARRYDASVTEKVQQDYNTRGEVGRFNKLLASHPVIKEISQVAGDLRNYHYKHTLPWEDEGIRIMPAGAFFEYSEGVRKRTSEFEAKVEELVKVWPEIMEDAEKRLNGMFKPEDYPRPDELRTKYAVSTSISPISSPDDFRVQLGDEQVSEIRADIERRLQEATAGAMSDLWQRLYDVVAHVVERLNTQTKGKDAVFRDSLIDNARELVEILPKLNLTGDERLEAMRKEVADKICRHDANMLRNSNTVRNQTAKNAEEILRKMKGYIG